MRKYRRIKARRLLAAPILLIFTFGIIQMVKYAINETAGRVLQLWDKKRILNEEALRHKQTFDIILSAYMNSGSTFTGKVLGFRQDAFYFYEPLWRLTLWGYYKTNFTVCSTRTTSCWKVSQKEANINKPIVGRSTKGVDLALLHDKDIVNNSRTPLEIAQRILQHVFHCRLLPLKNLVEPGVTENAVFSGPSWDLYRYCMQQNKPFEHCLKLLQESTCKTAKHRVSKVLRLSLGTLEDLLHEIPNLKVVHLFRDPRAIIHSRIETYGYPLERVTMPGAINSNAKSLCNKMSKDLVDGKRLSKRFPNRFRFIHYEDIYTRDYSLIKLHTFLGIPVSKTNLEFARFSLTNYGTLRSSSSRLERKDNNAFWWRKYLRWDVIKRVDKECSFLYKELGYPNISDKTDLTSFNATSLVQNLTFSFI